MNSTSSAVPAKLQTYSNIACSLDAEISADAGRLSSALASFESSCREPRFRMNASYAASDMSKFSNDARPADEWVAKIAHGFLAADARGLHFAQPDAYKDSPQSATQHVDTKAGHWIMPMLPNWWMGIGGLWLPGLFGNIGWWASKWISKWTVRAPAPEDAGSSNNTNATDLPEPTKVPVLQQEHAGAPQSEIVRSVPYIDQTSYSGTVVGAGSYLCSAAALTMALQSFLGTESVKYDDVADDMMEKNFLTEDGLLSGDYLERYINVSPYANEIGVTYAGDTVFNESYLIDQLEHDSLIIVTVPGHYTLVTGYRMTTDGSYEFRMSDSYREHWPASHQNAALRKEWITAAELGALWNGTANSGRHTIIRRKESNNSQ